MATDMKTCTTCGTTKLLDEFHNKKATKDGKNPQCKMCVKACNKKWALTHPRNTKSAYTKWRKSHRDYIAAFKRADRIKNIERELAAEAGRRERYNLNHPGENAAYSKTWKKDNAAKVNADCALRKAMKRNACPPWANLFFIEEAYDLAQRRTKATGFEWHVDHILPLKHKLFCGLHVEYNLQVIPGVDNIRKGNRVPPEILGASIVC